MLKLLLVVAGFVALSSASCVLPPQFWCDSKSIAKNCGVELACAEHVWLYEGEVKPVEPVKIELFFESLCPGCREFLTKMLYPTWKTFGSTKILEVVLYPYGNAHEKQDGSGMWNYTCQHGPDECVGNLIENCIQKYTKYNVMEYFPIFYCIESSENPVKAAEKCVSDAGLNWSVINTCANGPEGNALMHKSATVTDALNPKHEYVPWILVNGEHTEALQDAAQNNLPKLLCDTYKGPKPSECNEERNKAFRVSYHEL